MSKSFFYSQFDIEGIEWFETLKTHAESSFIQVYLLKQPLSERKYAYEVENSYVLLIPKHKILFINGGDSQESFDDFVDDFIEDIGYLADKYNYKKLLGRPREWKNIFVEKVNMTEVVNTDMLSFLGKFELSTPQLKRKVEFLLSLLTGSINDADRVGNEYPENVLERIKRKIILFDGDQTRFIYDESVKKRITIQGLAGTGKTELLLHKLKELYTDDNKNKIFFTCHNKVLADSLKNRVPDFFDFMKVEEQIKWNEQLWVASSWGSQYHKDSGLYSYICQQYGIPFQRFSYNKSFDKICKEAIDFLQSLGEIEKCFDYVLIDESQDFTENFFLLCEMVTSKSVYIAGDIFQNVFEEIVTDEVDPDFLLNKCYRTDPRTLMFAHSLAMGLYESPKLRWLDDKEWDACGYQIEQVSGYYHLTREPLRRFEDIDTDEFQSVEIISSDDLTYEENVLSIIEGIIDEHPTVTPDDIGIVFLENLNQNYKLVDRLAVTIYNKFQWNVNIGYESKIKLKDTLFISNRNNIKGLEFPFVIVVTRNILSDDLRQRNSIYMMLTRSFLKSYFVMPNTDQKIELLSNCLVSINNSNTLTIVEPNDDERQRLRNAIINNPSIRKSQKEIVEEIMDELGVPRSIRKDLHSAVKLFAKHDNDYSSLYDVVKMSYGMMSS